MNAPRSAVAVIGMSGRFPGASTLAQFWRNLHAGVESIRRFTPEELIASGVPAEIARDPAYVPAKGILEDIAGFDREFFGYSPREAETMDPQHRIFLECVWAALEHAGYDPLAYAGAIGLYAGCGDASYLHRLLQPARYTAEAAKEYANFFGNYRDFFATRVAYRLNLRGPCLGIQTACSTSLVAVNTACSALLNYQCDLAVAGGIHISVPHHSGNFHEAGAVVSPDGHCRPFDADAQGTVASDGAGVVILKRLDEALADGDTVHAVILGGAINNDGSGKIGYTAPSVEGQAEVIAMAHELAGISPDAVGYVEAHGTGTPLGDPIEIKALTRAFQRGAWQPGTCVIGSLKSNLGHLDAAAGVAGLIKTILALGHRTIPPTLNFHRPNPEIDFAGSPFVVGDRLRDWLPRQGRRIAGVSSFGIGGTNAHTIVEEAPAQPQPHSAKPAQLLVLSAKSAAALERAAGHLAAHLEAHPALDLGAVAHTLQAGRHPFAHRLALTAASLAEAVATLRSPAPAARRGLADEKRRPLALLFPGQGLQCVNMGRALYEHAPVFRDHVDAGALLARDHLDGLDLRTRLYPAGAQPDDTALDATEHAQPALFLVEYALAKYLESLGLVPDAMLGHSIGELVAAALAGVFSFEDAVRLVCRRGRAMQRCTPGGMLGVETDEAELQRLLAPELEIAVHNAPRWLAVSGPLPAIGQLAARLAVAGIAHHPLRVSHGFHSAAMEPAAADFERAFAGVALRPPERRFVSNVTGTWITAEQACRPSYWAQQLRRPVRFHQGLATLLAAPDRLLVEAGPGKSLGRFAAMQPPAPVVSVWPNARADAYTATLDAVGRLWLAGAEIAWPQLHAPERPGRIPLPTYSFEPTRCWAELSTAPRPAADPGPAVAPAEEAAAFPPKQPDLADWFYTPGWERRPPPAASATAPTPAILLTDGGTLHTPLLPLLGDVVLVSPGPEFRQVSPRRFTLPFADRTAYETLFATLSRSGPLPPRLVHAGHLGADSPTGPGAERATERYLELLALAQALGKSGYTPALFLVTTRLCAVLPGDGIDPAKATVLGPAKVIPLEYPGLRCRVIDLDEATLAAPQALGAEFGAADADRLVAYRGGQRWVETFAHRRLPAAADPAPLRANGVYLITGGLGGVGMALAESLVRRVRARIALVSRSAFPPADQWATWPAAAMLPALGDLLPVLLAAEQRLTREFAIRGLDDYPGLPAALHALSAACVLRYFRTACPDTAAIALPELRQRLGLAPRFERMFRLMTEVLVSAGARIDGDRLSLPDLPPLTAAAVAAQYPEFRGLIHFLDHCTRAYPEALSGKTPAIGVLYPDGTSALLDQVQRDTVDYSRQRIYAHALGDFLEPLAQGRRLRVLEIGGGQGLLTRVIAPRLLAAGARYHFTDISQFFVQRLAETAPELAALERGIFDITKDPRPQGLRPGGYDLIVGLDVVHATPDLGVVLAHLRGLLAPSGYLCLLETVATGPWVDLCWGLADGWWLFEDRWRDRSPLMSPEKWDELLAQAGFAATRTLPADPGERHRSDFALMLAQLPAAVPGDATLPDWCAEAGGDPEAVTHARIRRLREWERLGGEVAVFQGDVGDPAQLAGIVAAVNGRFGPIRGVIHSALVLEDQLMQLKEPLSARRVLAPKVRGSVALAQALQGQPLDFFAHCSSLAAPMGLYAQSDYCAATAFQDALAHAAKTPRVISINWGMWRDTGAAMRMKLHAAARAAGWAASPGPIFRRQRRAGDGPVIFEGELDGQWLVADHRLQGKMTLPGTGYLALACEASGTSGRPPFTLRQVVFSETLQVEPGQPRPIRLRLETTPAGRHFEVASLDGDQWIAHAEGEFGEAATPPPPVETLGALQQRFAFTDAAVAPDGEDAGLRSYGAVTVGPRWHRLLRWKSVHAREALGLLELPDAFADDLREYPLHPALLDVATSLGLGSEALYLPLGYDALHVCRPLSRRLWSHVTWDQGTDTLGATVSYRIALYQADGSLAATIDGYSLRRIDAPHAEQPRRLTIGTPGLLETLAYVPAVPHRLGADEIEIATIAAGLNFLDVLSALGMHLQLSAQDTGLGRECAGVVTRVGENVRTAKPGDEVIALAAHSFDDLAVAPAVCVRPKPTTLTWEEAAAFPVAFMTAHFALAHQARLRRGESVLIHAAAGGVGLAAVRLAQRTGAQIFATAGSEEKRAYLRSLGVASVFDSRSADFVAHVRAATAGRGVDVVLNSLGGDLMKASLGLLAPHGRFLELGKRDFAEDRQLGLSLFANGISYFAINLSPAIPVYGAVFDEVLALLQSGQIAPLPTRIFPRAEIAPAFAAMAAGRHIGKLVVSSPAATRTALRPHRVVRFEGIDAPLEDPQLREGMSSAEGAEAFARALASDCPQVLVSTQDFPTLLRLNTPEQVRRAKEAGLEKLAALPPPPAAPAPAVPATAPADGLLGQVADAWKKYLGVAHVGPEDNFFSLGGDSLIGIQVMAHLRKLLKLEVPVAAFFEAPTLRGLTRRLEELAAKNRELPATPAPALIPQPAQRHEPFPLTDVQQAYWVGRSAAFELGNIAAHGYFEVERDAFDYERFVGVWQRLVRRHDLLRMTVRPDGRQQVSPEVPAYRPAVLDLRAADSATTAQALGEVRHAMSNQVLPSDRWPLFDLRVSLLPAGRVRLHMSFDALIMDAWSSMILGREFAALYRDPAATLPALELTFRDCVLAEYALRETAVYTAAKNYWLDRLTSLPASPDLPLAHNPGELKDPRFTHRHARVSAPTWTRLKQRAAQAGLTPSVICLAAFGEVLARWSRHPRFTINLTLFNRPPLHPQINDIVGDFTSLTLLEIDASGAPAFRDLAQKIQQQLWRDLDHRHFSGVQVLRELVRTGQRSSGAIMPVVFTSTLALESRHESRSPVIFDGEVVYGISQTPQVWLDHGIVEEAGELVLNWNAVEELFPASLLDDMFAAYQALLSDLAGPESPWDETASLPLSPAQTEARAAYNRTAAPPVSARLETAFFAAAADAGDRCAVIAADRSLSYRELQAAAGQIAQALLASGPLAGGEPVGVLLEKGWRQIAAVLGILRLGGAYVPLDPRLPADRIASICAGMRRAIATDSAAGLLPATVQAVAVNGSDSTPDALPPPDAGDALAYVIYTSGSTGKPKGVAIRHFAALNTIADLNARFHVSAADRVFAISSLSFDLSVYDIFGLLSAGASLVMPDADGVRDPQRWLALLAAHRVTIWNSVPALMELLVEYAERTRLPLPGSLRLVLLSGDWIPVTLPARIRRLLPAAQIISLGGATEASIWSIYFPIESVDPRWTSIPYGYALAGQEYYVLNGRREDCPDWVTGELYIGGVGLADGYWQDPTRTAEHFITHRGRPLYRTGDLGRFRPEGWIEFQGRNDLQVKVQGYRIEIGEIETALQKHPLISKWAVHASGPPRGEKKLVAYYVPPAGAHPFRPEELRQFASKALPDYMAPKIFIPLPEIPLTANGKVNYRALPAPESVLPPASAAPRLGAVSGQVLTIIAELLKLPSVDPGANLLNLGADSIMMIRLANELQTQFGFRPNIAELYRMGSINALLRQCEAAVAPASAPAAQPAPGVTADGTALPPLLLDPDERRAFKERQPGLRRFPAEVPARPLPPAAPAASPAPVRRSHRRFSLQPLPFARVAQWLENLRPAPDGDKPHYRYPSAGGLYPVQSYIYAKAGRIAALDEGLYYYDPAAHRLVALAPGAVVPREIFDPLVNQPIFDEAAFCLFLVASLDAIQPIYGEHSDRFVAIEAGLVAQTLDLAAGELGLGLCHIGDLDFAAIRPHFQVGPNHRWLLALLGGALPEKETAPAGNALDRLVSRVSELSPDALRSLLAAKRPGSVEPQP